MREEDVHSELQQSFRTHGELHRNLLECLRGPPPLAEVGLARIRIAPDADAVASKKIGANDCLAWLR